MRNKNVFIHSSAYIDKGAKIGKGTKIWHNVHITGTAVIGENCSIGQNCYIAGIMKDDCRLQNNVNVYQGVVIDKSVFCGPSMTFTNDLTPRVKYPKNKHWISTFVEEGVSFGAGCVIVCGIKIGKWAFIGAGSVVTKNVPDYALIYGNPAVIKGFICECGEKMPEHFDKYSCKYCQRSFIRHGLHVEEIKDTKTKQKDIKNYTVIIPSKLKRNKVKSHRLTS